MSTKAEHSFSSVISVNPYKGTYLNSVSSFLTNTTSPEFSKDQFAISYINTKGFINAQIEISKNIPEEDLYDAINSKAYDELALDQAVSYHIQFIETFQNMDEDNRHFHVFIVDPLKLNETFLEAIDKVKYLDVIVPVPLLLKSLYSKEIIEHSAAHCFIYFQENDAFITIYNDKEFVYTKSIKYSFIEMHERFCELYGERVEYKSFLKFYSRQNLKTTEDDYKKYFIRLYKELFANINDILTYTKRAYDIEKFEHVYVGSQIDTVTKLDEMLEVELSVKSSEFDFDYGFESDSDYVDQLHALMHIYTTIPEDDKYECNFSLYHRPPKFIKRESGKIILIALASFILAFAYPVTYWTLTYAQMIQKDLLEENYKEVHNIKVTRASTIENKKADKDKASKLLKAEEKEYHDKKNTLIKIHQVKVDYPMKAKLLTMFTKDLNKYGVSIESLTYEEIEKNKIFTFNLVSKKDRKITKLVNYLTKTYARKFRFKLEEIIYDEESKVYFSQLKVSIL